MANPNAEQNVPTSAFRWLALATCAATYALVVVGGVVRATDSGDACPDWPRCHGELLPPLQSAVLIEFSHRLIATLVGLLVLALVATAWRSPRSARAVRWGALAALGLVGGQIVLGGMTVLNDLSSSLVMAHLATAAALLAALLVVVFAAFPPPAAEIIASRERLASLRTPALVAALATLALMLTGSYVSGSGAGLAFRDWPLFDGRLLPEGGRLAVIHATHRLAAAAVGVLLAYLVIRAWSARAGWREPAVLGSALALAIYAAQVLVGAANIWTLLQPAASAAHLALAMALWATLVVMTLVAHPATQGAGQPARAAVAGPRTVAQPLAGRRSPALADGVEPASAGGPS